jgi:hypothetical protein
MEVLVSLLNKYNFSRLSSQLTLPIVVHSVPGAGKTSLIRELIATDSRFKAYTYGKADEPNVRGAYIKAAIEGAPEEEFAVFDEYIAGRHPAWAFAVFADPSQGGGAEVLRAHFVKLHSHRFGSATSKLLQVLGYEITAAGEDTVEIADIYSKDPEGVVVFHEEVIGALLKRHNVESFCINEVRGQTFECVTFVTAEQGPIVDRTLSFQCLTRHRKKLLILCPDASYTSA